MYENNDPSYIQIDVDDLFHELSNIEFTVSNADSISIIIEDIESGLELLETKSKEMSEDTDLCNYIGKKYLEINSYKDKLAQIREAL